MLPAVPVVPANRNRELVPLRPLAPSQFDIALVTLLVRAATPPPAAPITPPAIAPWASAVNISLPLQPSWAPSWMRAYCPTASMPPANHMPAATDLATCCRNVRRPHPSAWVVASAAALELPPVLQEIASAISHVSRRNARDSSNWSRARFFCL